MNKLVSLLKNLPALGLCRVLCFVFCVKMCWAEPPHSFCCIASCDNCGELDKE